MNGILPALLGIISALHPGIFHPYIEESSQVFLHDIRVSHSLSYFGEGISDNFSDLSLRFRDISKDWKKKRKKQLQPYIDSEPVSLVIWSFQEKPEYFHRALQIFKKNVPHINIEIKTFTKKSEYALALKESLSKNTAPDAFLISNGWWPDIKDDVIPLPEELFSLEECTDFFFLFSCEAFSENNKMYGFPIFVKPLVAIANQGMLRDDRIALADSPPKIWSGYTEGTKRIQKYLSQKISFTSLPLSQVSGNISQIFTTLLLQAEQNEPLTRKSIEEILQFLKQIYSSSVREDAARNEKDPYNLFLSAEIAVFFAPKDVYQKFSAYFLHTASPKIKRSDIALFHLPQLRGKDSPVYSAESWGFAIPKTANHTDAALAFLTFLVEEENIEAFSRRSGNTPARDAIAAYDIFRETALVSKTPLGRTGTFDFESKFPDTIRDFFREEKTAEEVVHFILLYLEL